MLTFINNSMLTFTMFLERKVEFNNSVINAFSKNPSATDERIAAQIEPNPSRRKAILDKVIDILMPLRGTSKEIIQAYESNPNMSYKQLEDFFKERNKNISYAQISKTIKNYLRTGKIPEPELSTSYTKTYDMPAKTYDMPAKTYDMPAKTYDMPAKTYDMPAKTYDMPAKTYDMPAPKIPVTMYNTPYNPYRVRDKSDPYSLPSPDFGHTTGGGRRIRYKAYG